jgi:hypothetical protein
MSAAVMALIAAQSLTVCADRPGKASPTCTVPTGHVEVEVGLADWSVARGGGERDTTLALGQFTVKYGLTDQSQIALAVTPWERVTSRSGGGTASSSGFGDVVVDYRQRLTPAGAPLQIAASPFVKVPTARRPLGNRQWEGGLAVPIEYAIPKSTLAIAVTPELDWAADADEHGHHALASSVVSLGWQATPKLNLGAELWGQWDWDPAGSERQVSVDVAAAYLSSQTVQLDLGANFGLNRATPDADLYLGVSALF